VKTVDLNGSGTGEATVGHGYTMIATARTFRVNADQTTTPIVNLTAQSDTYGVQFTWTVLAKTWDTDGPAAFVPIKVDEVNQVCSHPHVQDFRTETDQGPSQVLYNYAVITVGTDDGSITDEVRVRMDQINNASTFGAIDATWQRLASVGAS
jgi:hypothetical protein